MSKTVRFVVKNDLPVATTRYVLVFLKPLDVRSNYQYHAWQNLQLPIGATASFDMKIFESQPSLYFLAVDPAIAGSNFILRDYSTATEYRLDASTDVVHVRWHQDRYSGKEKFSFDPPSRPGRTSFLAQPENKEGTYTDVHIVDVQTGEILQVGSTGSMSFYGVFACGDFEQGHHPALNQRYKIIATDPDGMRFERLMRCITSDL